MEQRAAAAARVVGAVFRRNMGTSAKIADATVEARATVRNAMGIHCRPSAVIIKEAADYPGRVRVVSESRECDLRSVIHLIALGLHQGAEVLIQVTGPDAAGFARKLAELFERHFDFPPREEGEPVAIPLDEAASSPPAT